MTKLEKIFMWIIAIFFTLLLALFVYEIIDFKNDYDCATTNDREWYVKHNCMRYER